MKRLLCVMLAVLTLCGCTAGPADTTAPAETTLPTETASPTETAPPPETTVPAETTVPVETTAPVETTGPAETEPAAKLPYTVRISDPETVIYAGPAFRTGGTGLVEEAGTYTIVEEATDSDGNLWGRLKSGAGWLCLTEPALAPIHADYAEETFNAYHAYWGEESDYITAIGITASETITDVQFGLLDWFETESYRMDEVLYTIDTMTPEQPFLAQVTFWGDLTTYGLSFTDADGTARHYYILISGKDGSLICQEYSK